MQLAYIATVKRYLWNWHIADVRNGIECDQLINCRLAYESGWLFWGSLIGMMYWYFGVYNWYRRDPARALWISRYVNYKDAQLLKSFMTLNGKQTVDYIKGAYVGNYTDRDINEWSCAKQQNVNVDSVGSVKRRKLACNGRRWHTCLGLYTII